MQQTMGQGVASDCEVGLVVWEREIDCRYREVMLMGEQGMAGTGRADQLGCLVARCRKAAVPDGAAEPAAIAGRSVARIHWDIAAAGEMSADCTGRKMRARDSRIRNQGTAASCTDSVVHSAGRMEAYQAAVGPSSSVVVDTVRSVVA